VQPGPAHLKLDEAQQLGDLDGAHAEGALEQQQHRDGVEIEAAQRQLVEQDHAGRGDAVRRSREDLRQRSEDRQARGSGFKSQGSGFSRTMLVEARQYAAPGRICGAALTGGRQAQGSGLDAVARRHRRPDKESLVLRSDGANPPPQSVLVLCNYKSAVPL